MTPAIRRACFFAFWGVVATLHAQPVPEQFTLFDRERVFQADGSRGPFAISDRRIEDASVRVWADGALLMRDRDYVVDANRALLTLLRDVARGTVIAVRFKQRPQVTTPIVRRRVLQPRDAEGDTPMPRMAPVVRERDEEQKLTIGGHKSISVTAGSQHAVHQALQVRISGEVAEGVALLAVLSDRNLPLGERGGSRRLRELDRVFFQVDANRISATLGDLDVAFDETVFGRYRRQLQGAHVFAHREKGQIAAFGAISRGRWETRRLAAIEGYQGPYQISGTARQIVPESDRVYLDERLHKRGDDYAIDYERGHISFAPEIPIGVESRITVEYQVIDAGRHNRLMGVESRLSLGKDASVGTTLIRESDRPAIAPSVGVGDATRQLGVVSAKYAPWAGARISGEVALSDRDLGMGRAFRLGGAWSARNFEVAGRFRQVGASFEAFERLDRGRVAGRWGWQADTTRTLQREGDVSARYHWGEAFSIAGEYGRRVGVRRTDRRSVDIRVPVGTYRYESLAHTEGNTSRHEGQLGVALGMVRPGFRFSLENGDGTGVGSTSLFYAARPSVLPRGIANRELIWQMALAEGRDWAWSSELKHRHFRQRGMGYNGHSTAWRDSLRGWSHTHRAQVANWKGWIFSGSYTRGTTQIGRSRERATHLGRVRLGHARPGLSHQITYRVSSIGVQTRQPVFIEVAPGYGAYIWGDANGDGLRDAEEFVPDVDGDYVRVTDGGHYDPARDGALGMRVELDFRRLIGPDHRLSALALDASLRAERQSASETRGATPWDLFGFDSGDGVLSARRDVLVRLYLFRYHSRGSLRLSSRVRHRVNRAFYEGEAEVFAEGNALGTWRPVHRLELETEFDVGRRRREGTGAFAYRIDSATGELRCAFRPSRRWHLRLGVLAGRDRERTRTLRVFYTGVQPEILCALPGRGRLRGRVDWTRVWTTDPMPLFLGLANGNRHGRNWTWRLGLDHRFGEYVTAQVMYDGRVRPDRQTVHLARVEMRAAF